MIELSWFPLNANTTDSAQTAPRCESMLFVQISVGDKVDLS